MFCKSCGAEMDDSCIRCTQCGNDPRAETGKDVKREETVYSARTKQKSKILAGILQIVLPMFAAGRIYLGNYSIACFQILISFIFQIRIPFTLYFIPLGLILPIYDGIRILMGRVRYDAYGRELK